MNTGIGDGTILFILSSLKIGGSEAKTVRLANALAARGRRIVLAYLNPPETLLSSVSPEVETVHLKRRGKFSLPALRRLVQLLGIRNVRAIVGVNLYPSLYGYLATLFRRKAGCRTVAWVNTTQFGTAKEEGQMLLYRHILRRTDTILFGAGIQRELWCQRYGLHRRGEHHVVLYNGVDTLRFDRARVQPVSPQERPATRFLLGNAARLNAEKSHVDLVRAVAKLRGQGLDVGAVIVGDGPTRGSIESEIRAAGLDSFVHIAGEVADVRPWLAALDVFVLTSTSETFSNSVLEAMSMECPIVSSLVGGMQEMLRFGGGVTYPAGDVSALSQQLSALLNDPGQRQKLAREARHVAVTQFGWERMVNDFTSHLGPEEPHARAALVSGTS